MVERAAALIEINKFDRNQLKIPNMLMEASISELKKQLSELVDLAQAGETIIILRHGRAVAKLTPMPVSRPWRVKKPDDPRTYQGINIDEPVLESPG